MPVSQLPLEGLKGVLANVKNLSNFPGGAKSGIRTMYVQLFLLTLTYSYLSVCN
jgi:hypothetical protein